MHLNTKSIFKLYVLLLIFLFTLSQFACSSSNSTDEISTSCEASGDLNVLVFTKTLGYRHSSIDEGVNVICDLGIENSFSLQHTEQSEIFNTQSLNQFELVIFLNTSGDVLNSEQQNAFESFIQNGGGFVGVHSASDTEYDWQWYGGLVGAYFESHPAIQTATINVEDNLHLSTQHLGVTWTRNDEWYNFGANPRSNVFVLLSLDESSYEGGNMNMDHPIAWYHEYDGGRAWYTAMGHTEATYSEALFRQHLLGGILWAAGR